MLSTFEIANTSLFHLVNRYHLLIKITTAILLTLLISVSITSSVSRIDTAYFHNQDASTHLSEAIFSQTLLHSAIQVHGCRQAEAHQILSASVYLLISGDSEAQEARDQYDLAVQETVLKETKRVYEEARKALLGVMFHRKPFTQPRVIQKSRTHTHGQSKALVPVPAQASIFVQAQSRFRKHKRSSQTLNPLKKLQKVMAAGVRKKTSKTAKQQQQQKSRLKKRLQALSSIVLSDSMSFACKSLPKATVTTSQHTPMKSNASISPRIFISRNGRLRGPDSVFAIPNFVASQLNAYTIDDPAKYKESIEVHLEMQAEMARACDPELIDDPNRIGWSPETFAAKFIVEVSLHRQKVAREHAVAQERKHEQMQIDAFDTVVPSIASQLFPPSAFTYPPPPPPPQPKQENKPMLNVYHAMLKCSRDSSAPAPHQPLYPTSCSGAATTQFAQRNTLTPFNLNTHPLFAHAQTSQRQPGNAAVPAKKALAPPPGARKATPMNITTQPLLTSEAPQNSQPSSSIGAVAAKKALAPPPGARRAVPMNIITMV